MTLKEFSPDHVWFCSVGIPTGCDCVEDDGYSLQESIPADWWDAEGEVDANGRWNWSGKGVVRDWRGNSVLNLAAFR